MSVAPVAAALSAFLGCDVPVESDVTGPGGRAAVERLSNGDVLMMENLRFHPGEEANDQDFAAALAALGEIYVGDAFSCTHRAHASVEAPRASPRRATLAPVFPAGSGQTRHVDGPPWHQHYGYMAG